MHSEHADLNASQCKKISTLTTVPQQEDLQE